jgi:hypothetical protein
MEEKKKELEQVEKELEDLRKNIKLKRDNIQDLHNLVLKQKGKRVPYYVYLLILIHFLGMLYGWSLNKGIIFSSNVWMHYWLLKSFYRDIYMMFAMPLSIFVIFISMVVY